LLPHRAHHTFDRHILIHRVIDAWRSRVALDQVQGAHDGLVHAIARTHVQHVEQPRHHASIVIAIGGAHLQVHLLLVATLGLVLLDNGFALLFADGEKMPARMVSSGWASAASAIWYRSRGLLSTRR